MNNLELRSRRGRGKEALGHLKQALVLLDEIQAPGEIGALVDHAIQRLRAALIHRSKLDEPPSAEQ